MKKIIVYDIQGDILSVHNVEDEFEQMSSNTEDPIDIGGTLVHIQEIDCIYNDNIINPLDLHKYKVNLTTGQLDKYSPEAYDKKYNTYKDPRKYKWNNITDAWDDIRSLDSIKQDLLVELKKKRDSIINNSLVFNNLEFDSDQVSQTRILGLQTAAQNNPNMFPVQWRLANNTWTELTEAQATGLWVALQNHIQSSFNIFKIHETNINNLENEEVAKQYDINQFW